MNQRWIGSALLCFLMLALFAHPSAARLSQGNFVPFSRAVSEIADRQTLLHRIEKGDSLYRIARKYNVKLDTLMLTNRLQEDTILEIGKTLKIPIAQEAVHIVAPGDTMSNLAARYEVKLEELIAYNQNKDPEWLEVGDCILIPSAVNPASGLFPVEPSRGNSSSALGWPVTGTISSSYGMRKSGFHHGLDIANKSGTPIKAAAAGTISFAGYKSVYGRTVIIDHPDGKQTLYAHAQSISVKKGDQVERGQVIAAVGVSGVTTGPHVHFEVRYEKKVLNPLNYLRR